MLKVSFRCAGVEPAMEGKLWETTKDIGYILYLLFIYCPVVALWELISGPFKKLKKNPDEYYKKLVKLMNKDKLKKAVDILRQLSDDKFIEIAKKAGEVKFTPQQLKDDIRLNDELIKIYHTELHQAREKLMHCTADEIADRNPKVEKILNDFSKFVNDDYYIAGSVFPWGIPKKFKALIDSCNKKETTEIWKKSDLDILVQHIEHFNYDVIEKNCYEIQNEDEKFYEFCRKVVPTVMRNPKQDFEIDDNATDAELLTQCEEDEGAVSYSFGQDPGSFLEFHYGDFLWTGCEFESIVLLLKLVKAAGKIKDIEK